jgi:flagellar protein FliJ
MASVSSSALHMLLDLAKEEAEQAMQQLTIANQTLKAEQEKSAMLHAYKQDYVDQLNALLAKGLAKQSHVNYQHFLQKLEQAINGQQEVTVNAADQRAKALEVLQSAQRKKMSFEVLIDRANQKAMKAANKREQKMMDECAMRAKRTHAS